MVMSESFFLSNMVPQVPNHNRGIWKQLETYVRNWVKEGKDIYVVSGTIYAPGYQTIGANRVGIPTHMWKVVVDRNSSKSIAFLFPNAPLPVQDLPKYATSIDSVEKATGINFMPRLTRAQEGKLEKGVNLADWSGLQ
jgi:endonuclease G